MKCLGIVVLASLVVCTSSSIAGNRDDDDDGHVFSKEDTATCDPVNWLPNSSLAVSVSRNLNGQWKTTFVAHNKLKSMNGTLNFNIEKTVIGCGESKYLALSGYIMDTDDYNFAGVSVKNINGEAKDSHKRSGVFLTTADLSYMNNTLKENLMEARKSSDRIQNIEDRLSGSDSTLADIKKTQTSFENTQNTFRGAITSFENTQSSFSSTQKRLENTQTGFKKDLTSFENTQRSFANRLTSIENTLKKMEKTIDQQNNNFAYIPIPCPMKFDNVHKGKNVKMSDDSRTAERINPSDYEYGGVMTSQPLKNEELFEIIIEETLHLNRYDGMAIGIIYDKQLDKSRIKEAQSIFYRYA